uniref:ATP synthase F0 subunit 8 n=1 Tax=Tassonia gloriae TaxID=3064207 RepID=UPI00286B4279|nr:ATP synthase F0 subunit 8 [Tassonia gloriae]WKV28889.1 ATP synthase F0 subunit 8 [Tassonia gloriae]
MPQMSPMLWLILYFYFLILFVLFVIMVYYLVVYQPVNKEGKIKINKFYSFKW